MNSVDAELHGLIEAEIGREASRLRSYTREAERHRGVSWAACGPGRFEADSPEALAGRAELARLERAAWRDSASGHYMRAVVEGQQIAEAAYHTCERGRAAWSRDFAGDPAACTSAARELTRQALQLLRRARAAERALASAAPACEPAPGGRTETPTDARE